MINNKKIIFLMILFLFIFGILINSSFKEKTIKQDIIPKITVNTYTVKKSKIKKIIELTGTVFPKEEIKISPRIEGDVVSIFKDSKDFVKKGTILAKIDNTDYKIKLFSAQASLAEAMGNKDIAKANVSIAKTNFKKSITDKQRYTKLYKEGAISGQELDGILTLYEVNFSKLKKAQQDYLYITKARINEAQARLDAKQKEFNDCTIKSPVNGYIIQKNIKIGNRIYKNKVAFIIAENNEYELFADVTESDIFVLKETQKVIITSTINKNLQLEGEIRKIEPYINPQTRMGQIKITLPSHKNIQYGMFLNAFITITDKKTSVIPQKALVFRNNKNIVFVVDDNNIVHQREVKIGIKNGDNIEILNNLEENEKIVTDGVGFLYDKDKVNIPLLY